MNQYIFWGIFFFTSALLFYSVGVWEEKLSRQLKKWHVWMFLFGVITDITGTWMMYEMVGSLKFTAHSISGLIGLLLMVLHFIWAFVVIMRNDKKAIRIFHSFSVFVWTVWMISYISGLVLGLQRI